MECTKCNQNKEPNYKCDTCMRLMCKICAKLTSSEIKCLQLKERVMKFTCEICEDFKPLLLMKRMLVDNKELIATKDRLISELEKKILRIESELVKRAERNEVMKESDSSNVSYADKAKQGVSENTLIIKAKNGEDNAEKIQQQIKESIRPEELHIGVANVRTMRSGKVAIEGMSKSDTKKLKEEIEDKLGQRYEITQAKMRKPRLKIVGLQEEITKENLKNIVLNQNTLGDIDDEKMKVITVYKARYNRNSAIIETHPDVYNKIMKLGKLKIGWSRCMVYEHTSLMRCYKCNNYNHVAKECTNVRTCGTCSSSEHETKECTSNTKRCINCIKTNEILQLSLDVNHSVYDKSCRVYQRKIEMWQRRTEYQADI